jgi:hypothetical protein
VLLERKSVLLRNTYTRSRASCNDLYKERSGAAALHYSLDQCEWAPQPAAPPL